MIRPYRGEYKLTQEFGVNKKDYETFGLLGHNGLDFGLPMSTQVIAPHAGRIIEATFDSGYGNYIKVENDKEGSVLAHLWSFQVKAGDIVSEGQPIALSGSTGNSTGPHLHWGYYRFPRDRKNGFNGFIDQLPLIGQATPGQQALLDQLRKERDDNWSKYQGALKVVDDFDKKITNLISENSKLSQKITNAKNILNS